MSEAVVAVRSIEIVTAEIHTIRDNVARVFMEGVVQIGRRLEEAKQLVPQGDWLRYLDEQLGYKPSTAQNYMRIAREFGDGQVGLSGKTPSDFFGKLGYSQLLPLLGLPEEEREQLAEENDLAEMSSREIQALVRERDEAKKNAERYEKSLADKAATEKQLAGQLEDVKRALGQAQARAEEQARASQENAQLAAGLQREVDRLTAETDKPRELTEEELAALRAEIAAEQDAALRDAEQRAAEAAAKLDKVKNPAAHKVNFLYGELCSVWNRLRAALDELGASDEAAAGKLTEAIKGTVRTWGE